MKILTLFFLALIILFFVTAFALPKGVSMTATAHTEQQIAYLSGGCFWGMEELVRKIPGVLETEVVRKNLGDYHLLKITRGKLALRFTPSPSAQRTMS